MRATLPLAPYSSAEFCGVEVMPTLATLSVLPSAETSKVS